MIGEMTFIGKLSGGLKRPVGPTALPADFVSSVIDVLEIQLNTFKGLNVDCTKRIIIIIIISRQVKPSQVKSSSL